MAKVSMKWEERLFIGVYPAGLVYADRGRERHGDYARCAFLSYATLVLEVEKEDPDYMGAREAALTSKPVKP